MAVGEPVVLEIVVVLWIASWRLVSKAASAIWALLILLKGETPVSLAEFTLASASGQTFYDISLVDGYNIPMAIVSLYPESGNSSLQEIPPNLTNPICIATASLLEDKGSTADAYSGTNESFPIPLDQTQSKSDVQRWCPWDLQLNKPTKPGDGVYPYPDDTIQRPIFNPCLSACAKYNKPSDCCTGSYNDPDICKPSLYSRNSKKVCPDAYSFGMPLPTPFPFLAQPSLHHETPSLMPSFHLNSLRRPNLNLHHTLRRRLRSSLLPDRPLLQYPKHNGQAIGTTSADGSCDCVAIG